MNLKQMILGGVVVLGAALALYAFLKPHGAAATSGDDDEATPSLVTVQTGVLKLATLHRYLTGYGTVESAPAMADQPAAGGPLAASVAGVVAKVNVVEGQHVEKGDVLVELNSGALTAESAAQEAARQEKLFAGQNTSQRNLEAAEAQLASLRISAPVAGTVTRLNAQAGAAVDVGAIVAEVVDLKRLAVSAEIPASEADDLKADEEVQLLTQPPVTTTLSFVSPAVNKDNDTVLVRALLPADNGLRPGQFIALRIVAEVHTNCLAAPAGSVVKDDSGQSVIALVKGDEAGQVPVQTGLLEDGLIEVTSPALKADDAVVTVGAYGLPEKTKITVQSPSGEEASTNASGGDEPTNSPSEK